MNREALVRALCYKRDISYILYYVNFQLRQNMIKKFRIFLSSCDYDHADEHVPFQVQDYCNITFPQNFFGKGLSNKI